LNTRPSKLKWTVARSVSLTFNICSAHYRPLRALKSRFAKSGNNLRSAAKFQQGFSGGFSSVNKFLRIKKPLFDAVKNAFSQPPRAKLLRRGTRPAKKIEPQVQLNVFAQLN
jgi:hypothetical protein